MSLTGKATDAWCFATCFFFPNVKNSNVYFLAEGNHVRPSVVRPLFNNSFSSPSSLSISAKQKHPIFLPPRVPPATIQLPLASSNYLKILKQHLSCLNIDTVIGCRAKELPSNIHSKAPANPYTDTPPFKAKKACGIIIKLL